MTTNNSLKLNYISLLWSNMHVALICFFLFFIPFSNTAKAVPNIILASLIILWLARKQYKEDWHKISHNPVFYAFLSFTLLYPLSLLWSDNLIWGWDIASSQFRYFAIPVIMMLAEKRHIKYYISAFIIGMTLAEFFSYTMYFGILFQELERPFATPFYLHTAYNPLLALSIAFLLITLLFKELSSPVKALAVLFIATMIMNMLITGGRNGQISMLLLMAAILFYYLKNKTNWIIATLISLTASITILFLAYSNINTFKDRIDLALNEIENYSPEKHTSVGLRLNYYINTLNMHKERPLTEKIIGSGVGDFPEDYNTYLRNNNELRMSPNSAAINHPHNQLLYQLGAMGTIGATLFLLIFYFLHRHHVANKDEFNVYRIIFILWLFITQIPDSLFLFKPISYTIIVFVAILFTSYPPKKSNNNQ